MFYTFARFMCFLFFKIFFQLRIFGRENFPAEGHVIVAPNHASFFDPVIIGVAAPRKITYLARDTLFKLKFFAKILYKVNTFPIKRERGDINAFRIALGRLSQGEPVLIFPEGTRSENGDFQKPRYGVGLIETVSNAPILPCYIEGSQKAWPKRARFPRLNPISIYFGRPLRFDKAFSGTKKERYIHISLEVMKAIGELKKNAG